MVKWTHTFGLCSNSRPHTLHFKPSTAPLPSPRFTVYSTIGEVPQHVGYFEIKLSCVRLNTSDQKESSDVLCFKFLCAILSLLSPYLYLLKRGRLISFTITKTPLYHYLTISFYFLLFSPITFYFFSIILSIPLYPLYPSILVSFPLLINALTLRINIY